MRQRVSCKRIAIYNSKVNLASELNNNEKINEFITNDTTIKILRTTISNGTISYQNIVDRIDDVRFNTLNTVPLIIYNKAKIVSRDMGFLTSWDMFSLLPHAEKIKKFKT